MLQITRISKLSKIFTLLFCLFVLASCASKKTAVNQPEIEEKPTFIFLNYNMVKIDSTQKNVTLINHKIIDGKLKNNTKTEFNTSIGDLECSIRDSNFNEIKKLSIKNPLVKIVEFVNDLGNFEKRKIDLDSAQFSLRLQLTPKTKYIIISELTQEGTKKQISTEIK